MPGDARLGADFSSTLQQPMIACMTMSTRQELERVIAQHAREHEAVARLGQLALRERELGRLFDEVVVTVIDVLDLQLCGVSRLREDETALDILVSIGQPNPPKVLPAGQRTQAGYALHTQEPVVSEDLRTETRFDSGPLQSMGMLSGMSAIIEGHERPFGVLSAHTRRARRFSAEDVNFLVAVANVLSAAVESNRKEAQARHAALHDSLTGLPNRTLALDRLDLALARRSRDGSTVGLLLLDLDHFTSFNDSLGHRAGDEVLVALVARLREMSRVSDTLARIGADEFALICECDGDVHDVVELAGRIGAALARPFPFQDGEKAFTASIGIAVADGPGDSSASMLRDADAAMYRAKRRGPGRFEVFDVEMRTQVLLRHRAETELRRAITGGQLCIHYQPILEVDSGRPIATEALVRWQHPEHGLIPPLDFIPVAEETGLIIELGRYVLEQACKQAAAWQRRFRTPLKMFVNVSGLQITNPTFPQEVADVTRRSGLAPGSLGLEVTESVLIQEKGSALNVLADLHEQGTRLVLDDFGTGYSSLSYLRSFPLQEVKIDRSFVDGLADGRSDSAIITAIIDICSALELGTVAEGVESKAQLTLLRELGCKHVQGYLLCHPMDARGISSYLARHLSAGEGRTVKALPSARSADPITR